MTPAESRAGRLRTAVEDAGRRAPPRVLRLVAGTTEGLREIEPFDRAMTLAAQAFTSIFPLIIVLAALLPDQAGSFADSISDTLGLPASSRAVLEQALPEQPETIGAFGVLGALIVVVSATSFSRALARMYAKVWGVSAPGWSTGWRWVAALFAVTASAVALRSLHRELDDTLVAHAAVLLLTLGLNAVVWTWVPWLLLARQVPWRRLVPGGLLMGLCTVAASLASAVYLPRAIASAARQFGALGLAFTAIGWMFVVAFALVCATVLGAVLVRDDGPVVRRLVGAGPEPA